MSTSIAISSAACKAAISSTDLLFLQIGLIAAILGLIGGFVLGFRSEHYEDSTRHAIAFGAVCGFLGLVISPVLVSIVYVFTEAFQRAFL